MVLVQGTVPGTIHSWHSGIIGDSHVCQSNINIISTQYSVLTCMHMIVRRGGHTVPGTVPCTIGSNLQLSSTPVYHLYGYICISSIIYYDYVICIIYTYEYHHSSASKLETLTCDTYFTVMVHVWYTVWLNDGPRSEANLNLKHESRDYTLEGQ